MTKYLSWEDLDQIEGLDKNNNDQGFLTWEDLDKIEESDVSESQPSFDDNMRTSTEMMRGGYQPSLMTEEKRPGLIEEFVTTLKETDPSRLIPVYRDFLDIEEFRNIKNKLRIIETGKTNQAGGKTYPFHGYVPPIGEREATPEEIQSAWDEINEFFKKVEKQEELGIGGKIATGITELVPFMAEFAATGGLANAPRAAIRQSARNFLRKYARGKIAKGGARGASWIVGSGARTIGMPARIASGMMRRTMPEMQLTPKGDLILSDPDDGYAEAFFKSFGDVWIENAAEVTGETLAGLATGLKKRIAGSLFKKTGDEIATESIKQQSSEFFANATKALSREWMRATGKSLADFIRAIKTRTGWNGMIKEVGEERLGDILRGLTGVTSTEELGLLPKEEYKNLSEEEKKEYWADTTFNRILASAYPGAEQLLVEAGVLAIPGAAFGAGGAIAKGITVVNDYLSTKDPQERKEKEQQVIEAIKLAQQERNEQSEEVFKGINEQLEQEQPTSLDQLEEDKLLDQTVAEPESAMEPEKLQPEETVEAPSIRDAEPESAMEPEKLQPEETVEAPSIRDKLIKKTGTYNREDYKQWYSDLTSDERTFLVNESGVGPETYFDTYAKTPRPDKEKPDTYFEDLMQRVKDALTDEPQKASEIAKKLGANPADTLTALQTLGWNKQALKTQKYTFTRAPEFKPIVKSTPEELEAMERDRRNAIEPISQEKLEQSATNVAEGRIDRSVAIRNINYEDEKKLDALIAEKKKQREKKFSVEKPKEVSEQDILDQLSEEPIHLDTLARNMNVPVQFLTGKLAMLEFSGKVKKLLGNRFQLISQGKAEKPEPEKSAKKKNKGLSPDKITAKFWEAHKKLGEKGADEASVPIPKLWNKLKNQITRKQFEDLLVKLSQKDRSIQLERRTTLEGLSKQEIKDSYHKMVKDEKTGKMEDRIFYLARRLKTKEKKKEEQPPLKQKIESEESIRFSTTPIDVNNKIAEYKSFMEVAKEKKWDELDSWFKNWVKELSATDLRDIHVAIYGEKSRFKNRKNPSKKEIRESLFNLLTELRQSKVQTFFSYTYKISPDRMRQLADLASSDITDTELADRAIEQGLIQPWQAPIVRDIVKEKPYSKKSTIPKVYEWTRTLREKLTQPVKIIESIEYLPDNLRESAIHEQKKGNRVRGLYNPASGEIYLIASNISTPIEAQEVVLHETIGHLGLHSALGKQFNDFLDWMIESKYKNEIASLAQRKQLADMQIAAEEWFAEQVETGRVDNSLWSRFKKFMRDLLRKLGILKEFSDADLQALIRLSYQAMQRPSSRFGAEIIGFPRFQVEEHIRLSTKERYPGLPEFKTQETFEDDGFLLPDGTITSNETSDGDILEHAGAAQQLLDNYMIHDPVNYAAQMEGMIKVNPQYGSMLIGREPTPSQYKSIEQYVTESMQKHKKGKLGTHRLVVEFSTPYIIEAETFDLTQPMDAQDVINAIKRYYQTNSKELTLAQKYYSGIRFSTVPPVIPSETKQIQVKQSLFTLGTQHLIDLVQSAKQFAQGKRPHSKKHDLNRLQPYFDVMSQYFDISPAAKRLWNSTQDDLHDLRFRTQKQIFGEDLKYIAHFAQKRPAEYKRWSEYIIQRDKDAVGYKVLQQKTKRKQGGKYKYYIQKPDKKSNVEKNGEILYFDDPELAWKYAHDLEREDLIKSKFSTYAGDALRSYRAITDREYHLLRQDANEYVKAITDIGGTAPVVPWVNEQGKTVPISISEALRKMGELRGSYYPRIRLQGEYGIWMTKGEERRFEMRDLYLLGVLPRIEQLKREGYTLGAMMEEGNEMVWKEVEKMPRYSEDFYQNLESITKTDALFKDAMKNMQKGTTGQTLADFGITGKWTQDKNGNPVYEAEFKTVPSKLVRDAMKSLGGRYYDDKWHFSTKDQSFEKTLLKRLHDMTIGNEMIAQFAHGFATTVANYLKQRGVQQRKITRRKETGIDVITGYETDPITAIVRMGISAAGGYAKKKFGIKAMNIINGTEIPWSDYKKEKENAGLKARYEDYTDMVNERRIDPRYQSNLYEASINHVQEVLRNEEKWDRILSYVKGAATFKYLAFRLSFGLINPTVLVINYPSDLKVMTGIDMKKAAPLLTRGINRYMKWRIQPDKMNANDKKLLDEINDRGWLEAQYDKDALDILRTQITRQTQAIMDKGMIIVTESEKAIRASSILAAYYGLRDKAKDEKKPFNHEDALMKAREVSNSANAVYGKINRPGFAQGSTPTALLARSFFTFKTFPYNYMRRMISFLQHKDHGYGMERREIGAFLWTAMSGSLVAGLEAGFLYSLIRPLFAEFFDDDPEELLYDFVQKNMGDIPERFVRHGALGALTKINLKESLKIHAGEFVPRNLADIVGAPASVFEDIGQGVQYLKEGEYGRAFEEFLPTGIGSPLRSMREAREGLTTRSKIPIFYGEDPVKSDWQDFLLRALSFNPSRISRIQEKLYSEQQLKQKYSERRTDIYKEIRDYELYKKNNNGIRNYSWEMTIQQMVYEYNETVKYLSKKYALPFITRESIVRSVRKAHRPPKRELLRAMILDGENEE